MPASLRSDGVGDHSGMPFGFAGVPICRLQVGISAGKSTGCSEILFVFHLHGMLYLYSEVLMLAIRLPQSIEKRLEKLARRTGRTKTFYVRQAILEHLDDLEDLYQAERTLDRIRAGEERTIP